MKDSYIFVTDPSKDIGELEYYCGAKILFMNVAEWLETFKQVKAKHKTEIRVIIEGESKSFTFKEFAERLGFNV